MISRKETAILELLSGGGELYGLEMVKASGGELKRGTVYVTLDRMEGKGLVESRLVPRPAGEPGRAKRVYTVTGLGSRALKAKQLAGRILRQELNPC